MLFENSGYNKVGEYIKELLSTDKIAVGDKLPTERVIAERLSISRNSIREDLRALANMGIIESKQGSGNYLVGNITQNIVNSLNMMLILKTTNRSEISQFRRYMDLSAFNIAFDNYGEVNIAELRKLLMKMDKATIEDKIHLDKEYHYLIISNSNNHLMMSIMDALSDIYEDFVGFVLTTSNDDTKNRLSESHWDIYRSFANNDRQLGIDAINYHYDIIEKELIEME